MKSMRNPLAFALAFVFSAANAQTFQSPALDFQNRRFVADQLMNERASADAARHAAGHRMQVTYQMSVSADRNTDLATQETSIAASHDALYDLIAHECDRLKPLLTMDCRIDTISVNNNSQIYGSTLNLSTSANAIFELTPAAPPQPVPAKP